MAESKEELKSLLMRVKGENEKAGLKPNIPKSKIMASSPITSWQIKGKKVEAVRLYFLGFQHHCRRRQWHPTPVLLPGKSYGWRSLVGCSPWGLWGSDTTEWLHFHFSLWKRQPTPVFLPGESQGQGSLVGCRLWGHTELDTTEVT